MDDFERIEVQPEARNGLLAMLLVGCTHCGLEIASHDWLDVVPVDRARGTIMKAGMRRIECCSECTEDHRLY